MTEYRQLSEEEKAIINKNLLKYAEEKEIAEHEHYLAKLFLDKGIHISFKKALNEAKKQVMAAEMKINEINSITKSLEEQLVKGVFVKKEEE
jgi:hypothetical protein